MHRPGCPSCRFNQRASGFADAICVYLSIFLMALISAQLWLIYRARKLFPDTEECREHRDSFKKT